MLYVSKHIMEILWARIFVKPQVYWEWGIYICFHLMVDYKAFNTECVWDFLSSTAVTEKLRVTGDFKELARLTGKVQHWEPRLNCVYDNMQYLGVAINNLLEPSLTYIPQHRPNPHNSPFSHCGRPRQH